MIGDRKTENIYTTIKDGNVSLENVKTTQPISGKSFVTSITKSDLQYDYSVTIPQSYKKATIMFYYQQGAENKHHIVKPSVYYRIGNPDVMGSPEVDSYSQNVDTTVFCTGMGHGFTRWTLQMTNTNAGSVTFYIKAFFYGTTTGTFTITTS